MMLRYPILHNHDFNKHSVIVMERTSQLEQFHKAVREANQLPYWSMLLDIESACKFLRDALTDLDRQDKFANQSL